jgi:hypothetical protein
VIRLGYRNFLCYARDQAEFIAFSKIKKNRIKNHICIEKKPSFRLGSVGDPKGKPGRSFDSTPIIDLSLRSEAFDGRGPLITLPLAIVWIDSGNESGIELETGKALCYFNVWERRHLIVSVQKEKKKEPDPSQQSLPRRASR